MTSNWIAEAQAISGVEEILQTGKYDLVPSNQFGGRSNSSTSDANDVHAAWNHDRVTSTQHCPPRPLSIVHHPENNKAYVIGEQVLVPSDVLSAYFFRIHHLGQRINHKARQISCNQFVV